MLNGTLTIHQSFGPLAALAAVMRASSANPNEAVYVTVAGPTLHVVFTLDTLDPTLATSFVVTDGSGTLYAEAAYTVSLDALDAALGDLPEVLAVVFGGLTTLALADDADVDLVAFQSSLTLLGNDLGTMFTLEGSPATVSAGAGDDQIVLHTDFGVGHIDGGEGDDTLRFVGADFVISVMVEGREIVIEDGQAGAQGIWSFDGIEVFRGSVGRENFRASGEGMRFEGGAGNDQFYSGGDEPFVDSVDYSGEVGPNGVVVNLGQTIDPTDMSWLDAGLAAALVAILAGDEATTGNGFSRDTFGDLDFIDAGFTIVGTGRADFFYGSSGAEMFHGGGGNDHFFGGDGNDTIEGGAGDDTFYLSLDQNAYDVTVEGGVFTIARTDGSETDTVSGVEVFSFNGVKVAASTFAPAAPAAVDDSNVADPVVEAATGVAGDPSAAGNVLDNDEGAHSGPLSVVEARAGSSGEYFAVGTSTVITGTYGSLKISADGSWTYALDDLAPATNALQAGTTAHDIFTYRISDGSLGDEATLDISIAGSNDGTAGGADSVSTREDEAISIGASDLTANDIDPEGETITLISVQDASHGTVQLSGGQVIFTPAADFHGAGSFSYTASYALGGTLTRQVEVTVESVSDAPTASDSVVTIAEDGAHTFAGADFGFSDVDSGDTLQAVIIASLPGSGTLKLSGATVNAGQTISANQISQLVYAPPANGNGAAFAAIGFKVSDGALESAVKTITINVTAVNDAPTANDDGLFAGPYLEDLAITLAQSILLANDTDVDSGQTLSIASVGGAQHGTVALVSGNVVFTPQASYSGAASFTYTATDGTLTSNTATVSFIILATPDAPSGADKTIVVAEDQSVTFAASDFGFSDPDADDTLQSVTISLLPSGGTLKLNGVALAAGQSVGVGQLSQLTFTPLANANGSPLTSFGFEVSDGVLQSATKTMTINVTAANDAPVANADLGAGLVTAEDTPLTIAASSLLANDIDAENDALAIASVGDAIGGAVVLNADGTVTFTPTANFNGQASFTYRSRDGSGAVSAAATVIVGVTAVNDAPAFITPGIGPSAVLAVLEGTLDVHSPLVSDLDSTSLTFSLQGPDASRFSYDGTTLRFAVAADYEAPGDSDANNVYNVTLVVSDGALPDSRSLAIRVLNAAGNTIDGTSRADTIDTVNKIGPLGATGEQDLIDGKGGNDTVFGAGGNDTLKGDAGDDALNGDAGNDLLRGGAGRDRLDGGSGVDTADYSDKKAGVVLALNGSKQVVPFVGGTAEDKVSNVENVTGGARSDALTGDAKANLLKGGAGDDKLDGGKANDSLDGGKGNDTLIGGFGNDTLTGGAGRDEFVFNTKLGGTNTDTVADFTHDTDLLHLSDAIFRTVGPTLDAAEFYAGAGAVKAHDRDDRIIYDTSTGRLYYDDDGKRGHAAIHFATLATKPVVDAGDFAVV